MNIAIRPIETHAEYRAVEHLQREIWGLEEAEVVPDHLLLTAHKNGGLVLGAFQPGPAGEEMVGFVFGFPGLTPEGGLKHCSHMAGVAPACQNQNLGYRLKLAQRQHVLAQGIPLITWTFDPLESRNAFLNFRKLGGACRTYLRDLYGSMRDALNVALPSDRFEVEWHIASRHVRDRLEGSRGGPSLAALRAAGASLLNPPLPGDPLRPAESPCPETGERLLIQIPAHFQAIKAADMELARAWRLHTRDLFETLFAGGYTVTDMLFEAGQSYYLLEQDWRPDENRAR
jgi:predicted GNAT superfamily acetyltransferase